LFSPPLYSGPPTMEYQMWATLKIASGIKLNQYHLKVESVTEKTRRGTEYLEGKDKQSKEVVVYSKDPHPIPIALIASEPIPVNSLDVKQMVEARGRLFFSRKSNEPLCDAAVVVENTLLLFQMTIGQGHGITTNTLNKFVADMKSNQLTKMELIFVVPHKGKFTLSRIEFDKLIAVASEERQHISAGLIELQPQHPRT